MRGYAKVFIPGMDPTAEKVRFDENMTIQFNKNGNFAVLIQRSGKSTWRKKYVPLNKIPAGYLRHEFTDMYLQDQQQAQFVAVQQNNPQPAPQQAQTARPNAICRYCGAPLEDIAKFCPNCGASRS